MTAKEEIQALYKDLPKSDREIVLDLKDELANALAREARIIDLFQVVRKYGFRGDRRKFTEFLQEFGLWTIRVGHRKVAVLKKLEIQPKKKEKKIPEQPKEEKLEQQNGSRKIWGGRYASSNESVAADAGEEKSREEILREKIGGKFF